MHAVIFADCYSDFVLARDLNLEDSDTFRPWSPTSILRKDLAYTQNRVNRVVSTTDGMIELGLARISTLLRHTPQPWKAIHVAGTNGKGSICAYLSAMLNASGVRCGRFTSPHLIDRWDCITINDETVRESIFKDAESLVLGRNSTEKIGASEFELLTATAFEVFAKEKIEMGVIEVGLGGRLDATNAMENKAVTIISRSA